MNGKYWQAKEAHDRRSCGETLAPLLWVPLPSSISTVSTLSFVKWYVGDARSLFARSANKQKEKLPLNLAYPLCVCVFLHSNVFGGYHGTESAAKVWVILCVLRPAFVGLVVVSRINYTNVRQNCMVIITGSVGYFNIKFTARDCFSFTAKQKNCWSKTKPLAHTDLYLGTWYEGGGGGSSQITPYHTRPHHKSHRSCMPPPPHGTDKGGCAGSETALG